MSLKEDSNSINEPFHSPNKAPTPTLECGSSLAEREYQDRKPPAQLRTTAVTKKLTVTSIDALRNLIADCVLTDPTSQHVMSTFTSPFNSTGSLNHQIPLVYTDQTASNRPVRSIETYIQNVCLPLYGNTHTNTSLTGSQTTAFCAEARQVVAEATHAKITGKASLDCVLFAYVTVLYAILLCILGVWFVYLCTMY
jgi:hypothetical protein